MVTRIHDTAGREDEQQGPTPVLTHLLLETRGRCLELRFGTDQHDDALDVRRHIRHVAQQKAGQETRDAGKEDGAPSEDLPATGHAACHLMLTH